MVQAFGIGRWGKQEKTTRVLLPLRGFFSAHLVIISANQKKQKRYKSFLIIFLFRIIFCLPI